MLDVEYREPPRRAFAVVVFTEFICKLSFMSIIPSAPDYVKALGGNDSDLFASVVIAASACVSGLMSFPLWWLHKRAPLRVILLVWCAAEATANLLYAAAGPLLSRWLLLIARVLSGLFSGPLQMAVYLSRSTGLRHRSAYMVLSTSSVAMGYVLGPVLTIVFNRLWPRLPNQEVAFDGFSLNAFTAPGWVLVPLSILNMVLILTAFDEPERGVLDAASAEAEVPVSFKSRCPVSAWAVCLCGLFITQMNFSAWYTFTTDQLVRNWGWSLSVVCGYVAVLMFVLVCLSYVGSLMAVQVADRSGMIASSALETIGLVIIWYSDRHCILYSVGSVVLLGSNELLRGFTWSLASKVSAPRFLQAVLAMNSLVSMLGLGVGVLLGSLLQEETILFVCLFICMACTAVVTAMSYPILVPYVL